MHKIYFNDKPLFIVNQLNPDLEEFLHHEDTVFIDEFNSHTVKAMLHEMETSKIRAGVFLFDDADAVLQAFKKKLVLIKAAGGFIYNEDHDVLMIYRRGKWDLPKGKLDDGEDLATCAEREIKEETGLLQVEVQKPLLVTYHTYHESGKHILKESHWYLVKAARQENFLPQFEEDIEKCEWVKTTALTSYLENTHASIVDVINSGLKELHELKNV